MDLGLELFIKTETAAAQARGDVAHVQSIRAFWVDGQSATASYGGVFTMQYNAPTRKAEMIETTIIRLRRRNTRIRCERLISSGLP